MAFEVNRSGSSYWLMTSIVGSLVGMSTKSLCPGYTQVESFGPDEDYEDEEVSYVTLDLGASVEPTLLASSSTYRLIVSYTVFLSFFL